MYRLIPLTKSECSIILVHIISDTIGSPLFISNISLLLLSLGFCYDNIYAAKVSINKLMIINWNYEKGDSLLSDEVIKMIIMILRLHVNSNSINFLTLTIMFLPYRIAFIRFSILPSWSTIFEASMAENEESAPIFTPTSASLNTAVSSW